MDTFVINLSQDVGRMSRMNEVLTSIGVPYERVEGTLGRALSASDRTTWGHLFAAGLSESEVGCCISHISLWRRFLQSGKERCLILEDDIHFGQEAAEVLNWVESQWKRDGILRLETFTARVTLELPPVARLRNRTICRMLSTQGGAGAYILSRRTAEALVSAVPHFRYMIDTEMFNPKLRVLRELEIFQMTPAVCIQDFHLTVERRVGFKSNIGPIRQEAVTKGRLYRVEKYIKDAMRPLYLGILNLWLSRQGKVHNEIEFL